MRVSLDTDAGCAWARSYPSRAARTVSSSDTSATGTSHQLS